MLESGRDDPAPDEHAAPDSLRHPRRHWHLHGRDARNDCARCFEGARGGREEGGMACLLQTDHTESVITRVFTAVNMFL